MLMSQVDHRVSWGRILRSTKAFLLTGAREALGAVRRGTRRVGRSLLRGFRGGSWATVGGGTIWHRLNEAWKASVEEAWNAYRAGSIPIGAAITDRRSNILARGRSRQYESAGAPGTVFGNPLSHAELNALLSLDYARFDPRECVLYTTVEPCPLCVGAAYMAGIRRILYASRDPRAGSSDMLGLLRI